MCTPERQHLRVVIDISYGCLLQMIINSDSQKHNTAVTLLLFALENTSMPYSEWRFGIHEGTLHYNTNLWLEMANKPETHVCHLLGKYFTARKHVIMHNILQLSTNELRCVVAVWQYKQWMAQFTEIQNFSHNDREMRAHVLYLQNLLLCTERIALDTILFSLQNPFTVDRADIALSHNMVYFLHLFQSTMHKLADPSYFDSLKSAADVLVHGNLFQAV